MGDQDKRTAYLAAEGFLDDLLAELGLRSELGPIEGVFDRLVIVRGPPRPAAWAQNVWHDPQMIEIASIGDAAQKLRDIQRNWVLYSVAQHRRAALIEARLPKVSGKPMVFGAPRPTAPLGSWTLLDEGTLLAAPHCSSPFPNGQARFVEDRLAPPSRAYLKLWEALTLLDERPGPGQRCLDLGSAPGGWTWVLQSLGAEVISVDKADLAPDVTAMPGVTHLRQSAFALDPLEVGSIDWLFSDVICYPERLFKLVERWRAAGVCRRFVCSVKFQGKTDHATAARFAALPHARLVHLSHNKHELTWISIDSP